MYRFLVPLKPKAVDQNLPNPALFSNAGTIHEANVEVSKVLDEQENSKKRRGNYSTYDDEFKTKVARYSMQNGDVAAIRKYSKDLPKKLSESTVRTWRNYLIAKEKIAKTGKECLIAGQRGHPLLLGADLDGKVKTYIRELRLNGGVVNRAIVISVAKAHLKNKDRSLLKEYGGSIDLTRSWANSFLLRMNFVKRKATKEARKVPSDFEEIKARYFDKISEIVRKYSIPDQMIINWDQSGISVVPTSEWTLEEEGATQVGVVGLEDKRQITALFASTMSGDLLPPQLIYEGKTSLSHPKFNFPPEWNISHTPSHWSNSQSMIEYVEKVIIPYVEKMRQELLLPLDQEALVIFDVFKAHRNEQLYDLLKRNKIEFVFVPANCTSMLQPLDADGSVNGAFKIALRQKFIDWYSDKVAAALRENAKPDINLRLSVLKPLHANWFLSAFEEIAQNREVIRNGWKKTGIYDLLKNPPKEPISISIL